MPPSVQMKGRRGFPGRDGDKVREFIMRIKLNMRIEDLDKHLMAYIMYFVIFCANFLTELSNWLWICRGHRDCQGYQDNLDQRGLEVFQ